MAGKIEKLTPKRGLIYATFALLLFFVIAISAIPLVIDFLHINWPDWATNTLISVGILVMAIFLGEIWAKDKLMNDTAGLYQIALKAFNEIRDRIRNGLEAFFDQFYEWEKERELEAKRVDFLVGMKIRRIVAWQIVKHIDLIDVQRMMAGPLVKTTKNGKEVKFAKITAEEAEAIRQSFGDSIQIDGYGPEYFLNASDGVTEGYGLEVGKKIDKKINKNTRFNRIFKIVLSVFISVLWAAITIKDVADGNPRKTIVYLVARMFGLFGGILGGYITSVSTVKFEAAKLKNKADILAKLETYYGNGEFRPMSYDDMVEAEIADSERQREEAVESVVVPEENNALLLRMNERADEQQ